MDYTNALDAIRRPEGMTGEEAGAFLDLLMTGELAVEEGAGLLVALAERGERGPELAAFVRGLRRRAVAVTGPARCMDVCGTGGSGLSRFNVSTTVAFILAAAGVPVVKHGNRGSKAPNGSFDLLEALGIPFELPSSALERLLAETGLCFLFARTMHPAVGAVVPYRKAAGRRSIFNLAGPLANPVAVSHQVIGTIDGSTARVMTEALAELGGSEALVVWGHPGIDECSISGSTHYFHVLHGQAAPGSLQVSATPYEAIPAGDATVNAGLFQGLIDGIESGPLHDLVCLNAGVALDLWDGRAPSAHGSGAHLAATLLADGSVRDLLERHRSLARDLAAA